MKQGTSKSTDPERKRFKTNRFITPMMNWIRLLKGLRLVIQATRLVTATCRPRQVIGMHFMNPPPIMKLAQIIRGANTSYETFNATKNLGERFGKIVVCSKDYSGFIVKGILMPIINEAFHALYIVVATKEDIDAKMKSGTDQSMGPSQLADFIGLDVCQSIVKTEDILHKTLTTILYIVNYLPLGISRASCAPRVPEALVLLSFLRLLYLKSL
ncbi:3-hydroxyacyl-CoA dehydrogenase family protein [Tanacetum coccineum]